MYATWQQAMGSKVGVLPVRLPGREARLNEPLSHSPDEIAAAIADRADRPYGIYGHSMGGRLGFEVVRALYRMGAQRPVRFYPAACRPPDQPDPLSYVVTLSDDEMLDALDEQLGGDQAELREYPELLELFVPVLRSDMEWLAGHRYQPGTPWDIPIAGFAGADDRQPPPWEMHGWARQTTAPFRLHTLPGGHFFLRTATDQLTGLIAADLLGA